MGNRTLELLDMEDTGPCECCGHMSRNVSGFVHHDGQPEAMYIVQWARDGVLGHGANFDFVVGPWGDDTKPADRDEVIGTPIAKHVFALSDEVWLQDARIAEVTTPPS